MVGLPRCCERSEIHSGRWAAEAERKAARQTGREQIKRGGVWELKCLTQWEREYEDQWHA